MSDSIGKQCAFVIIIINIIVKNIADYISGPYNVTFPAGVTRVSFNIVLNDDGITEGREAFNLTISEMLHPNVTFGSIHQAVVSIVDDASKLLLYNKNTCNELVKCLQRCVNFQSINIWGR